VKAFRLVSTTALVVTIFAAAILLAVSFSVGSFIPVLGWVAIPTGTTANIVCAGAVAVSALLTLISWWWCGPKKPADDDNTPPAPPEPIVPPPVQSEDNPTPERFGKTLAKATQNQTVNVVVNKSDYDVGSLVDFSHAVAEGVVVNVVLGGDAATAENVKKLLTSANLIFGEKHPTFKISCLTPLTGKVALSEKLAGEKLDVSGLTFNGEGEITPPSGADKALASLTIGAAQTDANTALIARAKAVTITGTGADFAIKPEFFEGGQGGTAASAKHFTVVPAGSGNTRVTLPDNKHITLSGKGVSANLTKAGQLDFLTPDSEVPRCIALTTAGALDLSKCGGSAPVVVASGVNKIIFGATNPEGGLTFADDNAVKAVTSVDLSSWTTDDKKLPQMRVPNDAALKPLSQALQNLTEVTLSKIAPISTTFLAGLNGHAALKTVKFPAGSTLPLELVVPSSVTTVDLGTNDLTHVTTIDLSSCAAEVEFKAEDPSVGISNLKAKFTKLTKLSVNKENLPTALNLPAKPGGSSATDPRIDEICVVGADGFSDTNKLNVKELTDRAKKVVLPKLTGADYNVTGLPSGDSAIAALGISLLGTNGTETPVTKLSDLTGSVAPTQPKLTAAAVTSGIASVGDDGVCYLTSAVGSNVKGFSAVPKTVLVEDPGSIQGLPLFPGVTVFRVNSDKTASAGDAMLKMAAGTSPTARLDLGGFATLKHVALSPSANACAAKGTADVPHVQELNIGGSVETIDLSKSETAGVEIPAQNAAGNLTLSAATHSVKIGGVEKFNAGKLDLSSLPKLKGFAASGADVKTLALSAQQALAIESLSLDSKDPITVTVDDKAINGDFSTFTGLKSLMVGPGGFDPAAIKLPPLCKTLVLSKSTTIKDGKLVVPAGVETLRIDAGILGTLKGLTLPQSVQRIVVIDADNKEVDLIASGRLTIEKSRFGVALEEVAITGDNKTITSVEIGNVGVKRLDLGGSTVTSVKFSDQDASKKLEDFRTSVGLTAVCVANNTNLVGTADKKLTLDAANFTALKTVSLSKSGAGITALEIGADGLEEIITGDVVTSLKLAAGSKSKLKTVSLGKSVTGVKFDETELVTAEKVANFSAGFDALTDLRVESSSITGIGVNASTIKVLYVPGSVVNVSADGSTTNSWVSGGSAADKTLTIPGAASALEEFVLSSAGVTTLKLEGNAPKVLGLSTGVTKLGIPDANALETCEALDISRAPGALAITAGTTPDPVDDWSTFSLANGATLITGADTNSKAYQLGRIGTLKLTGLPNASVAKLSVGPAFKKIIVPVDTDSKNLASRFTQVDANGADLGQAKVVIGNVEHEFATFQFNTAVTADLNVSGSVDGSNAKEILLIGDKENLTSLTLGRETTKVEYAADNTTGATKASLFTGASPDETLALDGFTGLTALNLGGCPKVHTLNLTAAKLESLIIGNALTTLTLPADGAGLECLDISKRNVGLKIGSDPFNDAHKLSLTGAFKGTLPTVTSGTTKLGGITTGLLTVDNADLPNVELGAAGTHVYIHPRLKPGEDQTIAAVRHDRVILSEKDLKALGDSALTLQLAADPKVANLADVKILVAGDDGTLTETSLRDLGCNVVVDIPTGGLSAGAELALGGSVAGGKSVTVKIDAADRIHVKTLDLSNGLKVQVGENSLVTADGVVSIDGFTAITEVSLGNQNVSKLILPAAQKANITGLDLSSTAATVAVELLDAATPPTSTAVTGFSGFSVLAKVVGDASKVALLMAPSGGATGGCIWTLTGALPDDKKYNFSGLLDGSTVILPISENGKVEKLNLNVTLQNTAGTSLTDLSSFAGLTDVTGTVAQYDALTAGFPGGAELTVTVTDALTTALAEKSALGGIFAGTTAVKKLRITQEAATAGLGHVGTWDATKLPLPKIECGPTPAALTDASLLTGLTQMLVGGESLKSSAAAAFFPASTTSLPNLEVVIATAPTGATDSAKEVISLEKLSPNWKSLKAIRIPEAVAKVVTIEGATAIDEAGRKVIHICKDPNDLSNVADADTIFNGLGLKPVTVPSAPVATAAATVVLGSGANIFDAVSTSTAVKFSGDWGKAKIDAKVAAANTTVTKLDISEVTNVDGLISNGISIGTTAGQGLSNVFTNVTELTLTADQVQHLDPSKFTGLTTLHIAGNKPIVNARLVLPSSCTEVVIDGVAALSTLTELTIGNASLKFIISGSSRTEVPVAKLFDGSTDTGGIDLSRVTKLALPAGLPATGGATTKFVVPNSVQTLYVDNDTLTAFDGEISLPGCIMNIFAGNSTSTTAATNLHLADSGATIEFMSETLKATSLKVRAPAAGATSAIACIKDRSALATAASNTLALKSIDCEIPATTAVCLSEKLAETLTRLKVTNCEKIETGTDGNNFTKVNHSGLSAALPKLSPAETLIPWKLDTTDITFDVAHIHPGTDLYIAKESWQALEKLTLTGNWTGKKIIVCDADGTTTTTVLNNGELDASLLTKVTKLTLSGTESITKVAVKPAAETAFVLSEIDISGADCTVEEVNISDRVKHGALTITATSSTKFTALVDHAKTGDAGAGTLTLTGAVQLEKLDLHGCTAANQAAIPDEAVATLTTLITGSVDVEAGSTSVLSAAALKTATNLVVLSTAKDIELENGGDTLGALAKLKAFQCGPLSCAGNGKTVDLSKCTALKYVQCKLVDRVKSIKFPATADVAYVDLANSKGLVNIEGLKSDLVQALFLQGCSAFREFGNSTKSSATEFDFSEFKALKVLDLESNPSVTKVIGIPDHVQFTRVRTAEVKHFETSSTGHTCLAGITGFGTADGDTTIAKTGEVVKIPTTAEKVYVGANPALVAHLQADTGDSSGSAGHGCKIAAERTDATAAAATNYETKEKEALTTLQTNVLGAEFQHIVA
jgi:hypothetical protein